MSKLHTLTKKIWEGDIERGDCFQDSCDKIIRQWLKEKAEDIAQDSNDTSVYGAKRKWLTYLDVEKHLELTKEMKLCKECGQEVDDGETS